MGDDPDVTDGTDATSASDVADVDDDAGAVRAAADTPDAVGVTDHEPSRTHSLLVWSLAAFHAALLVALVVAVLFFAGIAGNQLAALDTSVGVLAYVYLWGVTWWTNRRMLAVIGTDLVTGSANPSGVFAEAMKWGAAAGFLVFLPVLVVVLVLFVGAGGLEAVPFLVIAAAVGTIVSAGVGGVVGALFALLDLVLVRLASGWLPSDGGPGPTPTES